MTENDLNRLAFAILPAVRMRLGGTQAPVIRLDRSEEFTAAAENPETFDKWRKAWNGASVIFTEWQQPEDEMVTAVLTSSMKGEKGLMMLQGAGLLAWGQETVQVTVLLQGGRTVTKEARRGGPLAGRIALITGAAQGFGKGLAEHLAADGACVMIADINEERGRETAEELSEKSEKGAVAFVKTNVTDSRSVENMVRETVFAFGGLDLFISNAGVLKAGGLEVLGEEDFDFVTSVNYKGFYLGTKYASRVMKTQHHHAPEHFSDIIQINSKSGLQGSNRNFAYAGSKFGSIGLVQSFALELVTEKIKVNAVCPGNFFDGPLWSDPENGLFVQYLRAGKVAGATTIEDVRRHYESLVPMGRGTTVEDVYKAVRYLIDQEYETGQALPVTGGQVMLK